MKRVRKTFRYPSDWLKARQQNVNSTESSALFGLNPYLSNCKLWFDKKEMQPESLDDEPNTRMVWGTRLQDTIAKGVAEDNRWKVRRINQYMALPELRMGSSFDYEITSLEERPVLEIKNVGFTAFRDNWMQNGDEVQPPDHITLQVQHQLEVIDRDYAYIAALIGGNDIVLVRMNRDREIGELIKGKIKEFWLSIEADEPPMPIDSSDALRRWPYGVSGKSIALTDNVMATVERLRHLKNLRTELDAEAEALELQVKQEMGDAEALVDPNGKPICTWKSSVWSSIDTAALKAEMPEIAKKYTKESSTRTFRLAKSKAGLELSLPC